MSTLNSLLLGMLSPEARTQLSKVREVMISDPGALDTHSRENRVTVENSRGKDSTEVKRSPFTLGG